MVLDYTGLQAILNHFPLGILFANEKGDIPLFNEKACNLLGADPLDLMERGTGAFPAGTGLSEAMESLRLADRQKETIGMSRGKHWLSVTLMKGGLALFEEPCVLILVSDATEQRKLEEFRATCQGEFLHRIRGSLTSVKTSLAFLASEASPDLPEPVREIVSLGYAEVQRLHTLVLEMGELLALEGQSAEADLYLESVRLDGFMAKFLRRFRKTPVAHGREIILEALSPDLAAIKVVADYDKLGSVLGHLVSNALAYSPAQTPIRISIAAAAGVAEIRVSDQGPGITPEELPRVFEKFYRSSAAAKTEGSGLGLFLAKSYAEMMKGGVSLENHPGRGVLAVLRLPLAAEDGWVE